MMEDDKQLIPAITSDIVVSDPGQVKSDGRREVEVLRAVGTLVTISSVLPSKGQVLDAQNHCEVEPGGYRGSWLPQPCGTCCAGCCLRKPIFAHFMRKGKLLLVCFVLSFLL